MAGHYKGKDAALNGRRYISFSERAQQFHRSLRIKLSPRKRGKE